MSHRQVYLKPNPESSLFVLLLPFIRTYAAVYVRQKGCEGEQHISICVGSTNDIAQYSEKGQHGLGVRLHNLHLILLFYRKRCYEMNKNVFFWKAFRLTRL